MSEAKKYPRAPTWKYGRVFSLRLRDGKYTLFQMLDSKGYIAVFNVFSEKDDWNIDAISSMEPMFRPIATNAFFRRSVITLQKHVRPNDKLVAPTIETPTVHPGSDFEKITIWEGTPYERTFMTMGAGKNMLISCRLVNGEIMHDCKNISSDEYEKYRYFDSSELYAYPKLNEQLYLCSVFDDYVDPERELAFRRELPLEYETYIDIISGQVRLDELGY